MKHILFAGLIGFALMLTAAEGELLDNPKMENDAAGWVNWGRKLGLTLISTPEGLLVTGAGERSAFSFFSTLSMLSERASSTSSSVKGSGRSMARRKRCASALYPMAVL